VVVSDIFIILYYIIVLFFSKIRAPGRVRTANLTLGKDKAYHFTLVWLGPVIRAHASPGWAPFTPRAKYGEPLCHFNVCFQYYDSLIFSTT
jgi:hypothetical protein